MISDIWNIWNSEKENLQTKASIVWLSYLQDII